MGIFDLALSTSPVLPLTPPSRIKLFNARPCQDNFGILLQTRHITSSKCYMKATLSLFSEPEKINTKLSIIKERVGEAIPNPVKQFPWKTAEDVLLDRMLTSARKVLKWSLITLFMISSLSDVLFAILRNKELLIPVGLFVGCLLADFLKEVALEIFSDNENRGMLPHFTAPSCFFVLLKLASGYCSLQTKVFLSNVANGGLMQVLWLWRSLNERRNDEDSSTQEVKVPL